MMISNIPSKIPRNSSTLGWLFGTVAVQTPLDLLLKALPASLSSERPGRTTWVVWGQRDHSGRPGGGNNGDNATHLTADLHNAAGSNAWPIVGYTYLLPCASPP